MCIFDKQFIFILWSLSTSVISYNYLLFEDFPITQDIFRSEIGAKMKLLRHQDILRKQQKTFPTPEYYYKRNASSLMVMVNRLHRFDNRIHSHYKHLVLCSLHETRKSIPDVPKSKFNNIAGSLYNTYYSNFTYPYSEEETIVSAARGLISLQEMYVQNLTQYSVGILDIKNIEPNRRSTMLVRA